MGKYKRPIFAAPSNKQNIYYYFLRSFAMQLCTSNKQIPCFVSLSDVLGIYNLLRTFQLSFLRMILVTLVEPDHERNGRMRRPLVVAGRCRSLHLPSPLFQDDLTLQRDDQFQTPSLQLLDDYFRLSYQNILEITRRGPPVINFQTQLQVPETPEAIVIGVNKLTEMQTIS